MDIEEVAKTNPEKIKTVPINIMEGLSGSTAKDIAKFLEFDSSSVDQVINYNYFYLSSVRLIMNWVLNT